MTAPAYRADPTFRLIETNENHAMATAFNMLFLVWHKETSFDAMVRAGRLVNELSVRNPGGIGVLQLVDVGSKPPDSAARAGIAEFLQVGAGKVQHSSVVHEGAGFSAAAVRAVMASIHMLYRPKFTHVTLSSLEQAATFHAEHQKRIGRIELSESILNALHQLRASL